MRTPSLDDLRNAATAIAREAGYDLVALFGSVARGDANARDVDIGIVSATPVDTLDATNRFVAALRVGEVDVVDLRRADPVLLMCVAREGQPLFEATPSAFAAFASLAMRRYADTRKFRHAVREELREYAAGEP